MRKFHVNVNGTPYEVEVEEIAAGAAPRSSRSGSRSRTRPCCRRPRCGRRYKRYRAHARQHS